MYIDSMMNRMNSLFYISESKVKADEKIAYNIPWYYENGAKIGDTNAIWDDDFIDKYIKIPKIQNMIDNGVYYIQHYPTLDHSITRHMCIDPNASIAKIININHNGVNVILDNYDTISKIEEFKAYPMMIHYHDEIAFLGSIYLIPNIV